MGSYFNISLSVFRQPYAEGATRPDHVGKGLLSLGLQQREKLVIYADTRADWLMAAIGKNFFRFLFVGSPRHRRPRCVHLM